MKQIPIAEKHKEEEEVLEEEEIAVREITGSIKSSSSGLFSYTPFRQLEFLYRLFFSAKFLGHRIGGLSYLIQWTAAIVWYYYDYETFKDSMLIWHVYLT